MTRPLIVVAGARFVDLNVWDLADSSVNPTKPDEGRNKHNLSAPTGFLPSLRLPFSPSLLDQL